MNRLLRVLALSLPLAFFVTSCCTKNAVSPEESSSWDRPAQTATKSIYQIGFIIPANAYEVQQIQLVGTGFAVSGHRIITNAHVAAALAALTSDTLVPVAVSCENDIHASRIIPLNKYRIHPFYAGTINSADLAVLFVDSTLHDSLTIATDAEFSELAAGTQIGTVGFPGETRIWSLIEPMPTFKNGSISSMLPLDKSDTTILHSFLLQHNLNLTGGTSGSPLFDDQGHVLAVNNSTIPYSSIGFGISAAYIGSLLSIASFDSFTTVTPTDNRRTFTRAMRGQAAWLDTMLLESTSFAAVKGYFGNDYTLIRDNDSLMFVGYTDHRSHQLVFIIEKGKWFSRNSDVVASVCITNALNQHSPNTFSDLFYNEISVGSNKVGIQLKYGTCAQKTTRGALLQYQYSVSNDNYNISFLFFKQDESCSAILLPGNSKANTIPYADLLDTTFIPRYNTSGGGSIAVWRDTTVQIRDNAGLLLSSRTYALGVLNGLYIEYHSNGATRLSGTYSAGKRSGEFFTYDTAGLLLSLNTFANDTLSGRTVGFYAITGRTSGMDTASYGTYSHGLLSGSYREFYSNGKIFRQRTFVSGMRTDTLLEYYSDDTLKIRAIYANDSLNGEYLEYFPDGRLKIHAFYFKSSYDSLFTQYILSGDSILISETRIYKKGKLNGVSKTYWPNGKLRSEHSYINGQLSGIVNTYISSGLLSKSTPYANGLMHGDEYEYFSDGIHVRYKTTYANNLVVYKIEYTLAGVIVSENRYP